MVGAQMSIKKQLLAPVIYMLKYVGMSDYPKKIFKQKLLTEVLSILSLHADGVCVSLSGHDWPKGHSRLSWQELLTT